jgi:hypothetical protein
MSATENTPRLFGLVARFESPEALYDAAQKTCSEGYTKTDAHSPFPVHGLAEALGMKRSKLSAIVLAAGATGALSGLALQYWVSAVTYPLNVGGRPYFSWPIFIPIIFECMVLLAGLSALFFMLSLNGLPQPYHPVFNTPDFERASNDGFFLSIEAEDPKYDDAQTRSFLEGAGALEVHEVSG